MRFDQKSFAEEYDRRLSAEGYPGALLEEVAGELAGLRSVIDVGAGSGFFALPLARRGFEVRAVEPSRAMLSILRRKTGGVNPAGIRLYQTGWERWRGDYADALICIHSLYPMRNHRAALLKMLRSAGRRIVLVRAASGTRNVSDILRRELVKQREAIDFSALVADFLRENGIHYGSREIEQRRSFAFDDPGDEARYYCAHLGLDVTVLPEVTRILLQNSETRGGGYLTRGVYRDTLFTF